MGLMKAFPEILEAGRTEYEHMLAGDFPVREEYGAERSGLPQGSGSHWRNLLALGENGAFMKALLRDENMAGKVQMVYMDPPFFSKANYDAVIRLEGAAEDGGPLSVKHLAYEDVWSQGIGAYLTMLAARLYLVRDLLSEEGTVWIHLDWHAVHYVRLLMDEIFGAEHFVNEIIWTYKSGGAGKKHFARKHDTILVYSKTKDYYFKPLKEKSYNRGFKPYRFKGVEEFQDEIGWYTMVNMKDVWQIDMVGRTSSERTGYATQKPEALLERILESSSREGDICADFFCGSGTMAAVAQKMNRRWACCDVGQLAIAGSQKRILADGRSEAAVICGTFSYGKLKAECLQQKAGEKETSLTIRLTGYEADRRSKVRLEEETGELLLKMQELQPLSLIDWWSIDLNYDGKVHRPSRWVQRNRKGKMETEQNFMLTAKEKPQTISVVAADVLGNRYQTVLKP